MGRVPPKVTDTWFQRGPPIISDKEEYFIERSKKDKDDVTVKDAYDQFILVATLKYGKDWEDSQNSSETESRPASWGGPR